MSTSVTNRSLLKTAFTYLLISLFVALFGAIYEVFSYGVYSNFMIYAFAFPLVGGCLPFFAMGFLTPPSRYSTIKHPTALSRNLYHSGIATLTVGSVIRGVLEIYGTTNALSDYYWIVGIALVVAGVVCYLFAPKPSANIPLS